MKRLGRFLLSWLVVIVQTVFTWFCALALLVLAVICCLELVDRYGPETWWFIAAFVFLGYTGFITWITREGK